MQNDELITLVEKMPAFPSSVQRIIQLASEIDSSCKDIVEVIESDPVMTVRILKVINSAFYGLPKKVNSVQRAVVHIGINTVKNMALGVAMIGVLNPQNKADFDILQFQLHSLTTAALCKMLAAKLKTPAVQQSDFFVAGLLHDFGKVVFAEYVPEGFKQALHKSAEEHRPLHMCELEFIGADHSEVGSMLAQRWAFDQQLVDAINHHHTLNPQTMLTQCLFAANQISKKMHLGDAGNPVIEEFPEAVSAVFGMDLTDLIESLGDLSTLRAEALALIY